MVKLKAVFRCDACESEAPQWSGRCGACGEWNSLVERASRPSSAPSPGHQAAHSPQPLSEIDATDGVARAIGIAELDRVLSGGLVPGSVTLLGGEPGIGKSTLLLQAAACWASSGSTVLYVSAEESKQQVRLRAERLGLLSPFVWLASEVEVPVIVDHIDQLRPGLVVVDSIQTVFDPAVGSASGSMTQVRECAQRLVQESKRRDTATVLVGHVTKDGGLAGPRVLEHSVDTVLAFEGDRHHALRLLRATKHRFGSTNELGLFEMGEAGLTGVPDPSALFLADRGDGVPGSVVVPTMEGHRPLLVEIQALVAATKLPSPRRSAQGLDSGRLALLAAVLGERVGLPLADLDVYALAVGGVRVVEPGADLAVALAVVSAGCNVALPDDLVACGEVGLGGELRQVSQTGRRLKEAARLGFRRAVVPMSAPDGPAGMELIRAPDLQRAIYACFSADDLAAGRTALRSVPTGPA